MRATKFIPVARLNISTDCALQICISVEQGVTYVFSAFYDNSGNKTSAITKSLVRADAKGHAYFVKARQVYYLNDFTKKPLC